MQASSSVQNIATTVTAANTNFFDRESWLPVFLGRFDVRLWRDIGSISRVPKTEIVLKPMKTSGRR